MVSIINIVIIDNGNSEVRIRFLFPFWKWLPIFYYAQNKELRICITSNAYIRKEIKRERDTEKTQIK